MKTNVSQLQASSLQGPTETDVFTTNTGKFFIILNAIGSEDSGSRALAIVKAINFIGSLKKLLLLNLPNINIILWMYQDGFFYVPEFSKQQLQNMSAISTRFYSNHSLEDHNIGRNKKEVEFITAILESLLSETFSTDSKAVLLSISHEVKMTPSVNFLRIFKYIGKENLPNASSSLKQCHLKLLGKTKRMTSVSDWRDLMVVALFIGDPAVKEWLLRVKHVYYRHATDRLAATLFDPRPALLEATLQLRKTVRVGYFRSGEICARKSSTEASKCKEKSFLEVECVSHDKIANQVCTTLSEPHTWIHTIDKEFKQFPFPTKDMSRFHEPFDDGPIRFLLGAKNGKPAPFCWQNK